MFFIKKILFNLVARGCTHISLRLYMHVKTNVCQLISIALVRKLCFFHSSRLAVLAMAMHVYNIYFELIQSREVVKLTRLYQPVFSIVPSLMLRSDEKTRYKYFCYIFKAISDQQ